MAKMPDMIPVAEAAKLLGVSGTRVREYIHAKRLSADKVGGVFILSRAEVLGFERRHAGRPKKSNGSRNGQKPTPPKARDLQAGPKATGNETTRSITREDAQA